MRWLLRVCENCGRYTLARDRCPACGGPLRVPHPPRFSPIDRYVRYRIMAKASATKPELHSREPESSPGVLAEGSGLGETTRGPSSG